MTPKKVRRASDVSLNLWWGAGRWSKTRYRLYVARDLGLAVLGVLVALGLAAWLIYTIDSNRELVRLLTGSASDRPGLYCWIALIGSLAAVGLAASCYQLYLWCVVVGCG